jgi:hypothetical protein
MLEVLALVFLSKKIGAIAEQKGLKASGWKLRLVLFWILGEISGVVVAGLIFGFDNIISCLLVGIGCAVSAYFLLKAYLEKLPNTFDDDINNIGN